MPSQSMSLWFAERAGPALRFLERYVRKPMEGSTLDIKVFKPAKDYYMTIIKKD